MGRRKVIQQVSQHFAKKQQMDFGYLRDKRFQR
jgi:hypothetical protein